MFHAYMPRPRHLPAPENDNFIAYSDVRALSLYDVRALATEHAANLVKTLYPPLGGDGIAELTQLLKTDFELMRDISWRATDLARETIDRMPPWELARVVLYATVRTYRTVQAGTRVRRTIIASVNAVYKGRNLATPLGLKVVA